MIYEIPLFELNFDQAEEKAVAEAVRSGWISMGPRTAKLERRFARELGGRHVVAVGSGTAALHLALAGTIDPGDEVIVPALTFVATANAIRYAGGRPVFADIVSDEEPCLDPEDVAKRITPRTRAILAVHYGGFVRRMDELAELARTHGLTLLEDAAHAPLTGHGAHRAGTFGRAACFSFFSNKVISCAEGGLLATEDKALASRARLMRSHGMTTLSYDRARGHATGYDVVELGYNYRLDDIRAALALVQLDKLPGEVRRRNRVRQWYEDRLAAVAGIVIPFAGHTETSSQYIFPIVLGEGGAAHREAVRRRMAERGIQTSVHYPPVHQFSFYREVGAELPRTEGYAQREITLPMYGNLTESQVDRIVEALSRALEPSS